MLTGDYRRFPNEIGAPMGGIVRVFDPYKYRSMLFKDGMPDEEFSELCLRQLEETIIFENPESIAAMFLETVTGRQAAAAFFFIISYHLVSPRILLLLYVCVGTNGIIPPPDGYLPGLRRLLSKYGIMVS